VRRRIRKTTKREKERRACAISEKGYKARGPVKNL